MMFKHVLGIYANMQVLVGIYVIAPLLFICIILLQCRAFAKALHYKEMEFEGALSKKMDANPVAVVEALIHTHS